MSISDPGNEKRIVSYRQEIVLPGAQETYIPIPPQILESAIGRGGRGE